MGLFFIVVVIAIVWILAAQGGTIFNAGNRAPAATPADTPLEILRKRYARGEIDRTEFEERRRELVS